MAEQIEITAVICTHNRAGFLDKCIQSLYNQTLEQGRYEVIVVDNASTDETEMVCRKYKDYPCFIYIKDPILGLSHARNTGWQSANSEYVGYIDDDAVACSEWLEKILWSFEEVKPSPDWVGGAIHLKWENVPPSWMNEELKGSLGKVELSEKPRFLKSGEVLGGGNSFFRKNILEELGGFDTRLGRQNGLLLSGEETQLQYRISALGGKLFYHPDAYIQHYVFEDKTKPIWFYRRYFWGGVTNYVMRKTLKSISQEEIECAFHGRMPIWRLLKNGIKALGISLNRDETIRSRIYLSYVLGWMVEIFSKGRIRGLRVFYWR